MKTIDHRIVVILVLALAAAFPLSAKASPPDPRFGMVESFVNPAAAGEAGVGYTRIILRWDVIQPGSPADWKPANLPDPVVPAELAAGRRAVEVPHVLAPRRADEVCQGASRGIETADQRGILDYVNGQRQRRKVCFRQPHRRIVMTRDALEAIESATAMKARPLEKYESFVRAFTRIVIGNRGLPAGGRKPTDAFLAWQTFAREAAEFVNVYSKGRGINRFPALIEALEWLQNRAEVVARGVKIEIPPTLAAWVNCVLLGLTLSRRGLFSLDELSRVRLPRIVVSGIFMGILLLAGAWALRDNYAEGRGFMAAAWGLLLLVTGGGLSYFAIAHLTGAMRLGEMKSMLKR